MIEVEPWVVLMAIRYGLPRMTYAHGDAINLTIKHANQLRQWSDSLIPDIGRASCNDPFCLRRHLEAIDALTQEAA